jgi:hypothetical protein
MPCYGQCAGNYAAGDYYRGDYYRGDPFLHKKIIGGIKKVAGVAVNLLPGPVGAVARGLVKYAGAGSAVGGFESVGPSLGYAPPAGMTLAPPGMNGGPPLSSQGVLDVIGACAPGGRLLRGFRWNKSGYFTKGGGTSRWPEAVQYHPKGTTCVKTRRMNVANPRALRRALRRAQGFSKLARRFVSVQRRFKKGKRRKR